VNCGLPAQSPSAQTSGAVVSSRSLTCKTAEQAVSDPAPLLRLLQRSERLVAVDAVPPDLGAVLMPATHLDAVGHDSPAGYLKSNKHAKAWPKAVSPLCTLSSSVI
jgi:hypothetical protein